MVDVNVLIKSKYFNRVLDHLTQLPWSVASGSIRNASNRSVNQPAGIAQPIVHCGILVINFPRRPTVIHTGGTMKLSAAFQASCCGFPSVSTSHGVNNP